MHTFFIMVADAPIYKYEFERKYDTGYMLLCVILYERMGHSLNGLYEVYTVAV